MKSIAIVACFLLPSCAAHLEVWDGDRRLPGIPVKVDKDDPDSVVHLNVKASWFGQNKVTVKLNEDGTLQEFVMDSKTAEGTFIGSLPQALPLLAAIAAAFVAGEDSD